MGSPKNQRGAESALGEAEGSHAEAIDLSGGKEADRGGSESKVGEGEENGVSLISGIHATGFA